MRTELLKIIPSQPEEVDIAVPLIYSSGPPSFEYVLQTEKSKAQDFLKYAFTRKGGEFSFDNHVSLYHGEMMVGIGSTFDAQKASGFTIHDGLKIIKYFGLNSIGVVKRGLSVEQIIKLPKKNEVALAHLAIKEEWKGKGLGTYLIHHLLGQHQKENKQFILDVSEENPRAKDLYHKLGFEVTHKNLSKLKNKYSHVAHHFRMELQE